jgi:hypothetical protein
MAAAYTLIRGTQRGSSSPLGGRRRDPSTAEQLRREAQPIGDMFTVPCRMC